MPNSYRAKQAVRAWQEHLITENEALEIAGVATGADLIAVAGPGDERVRPAAGRGRDGSELDRAAVDPRSSRS